jgi:hypothetical protein
MACRLEVHGRLLAGPSAGSTLHGSAAPLPQADLGRLPRPRVKLAAAIAGSDHDAMTSEIWPHLQELS